MVNILSMIENTPFGDRFCYSSVLFFEYSTMNEPCHGQEGVGGMLQVVVLCLTAAVPGILTGKKSYNIGENSVERFKVKISKKGGSDIFDLIQDGARIFHIHKA